MRILEVSLADAHDRIVHGTLGCDCPREHPIIDGVPVVVRDLLAYLASERDSILERRDLPPWANDLLGLASDDPEAEAWRAHTLTTYAGPRSEEPALAALSKPLWAFVEQTIHHHAPGARFGLDAGAAAGAFTRVLARHVECAVGLEIAFDRARHARESSLADDRRPFFVAGSADDPPFAAGSFQVVLALNLLDVVPQPRKLLDQVAALLAPDGLLVLTTPFAYTLAQTPLDEQIDDEELDAALTDRFAILENRPQIPWHLPTSERHHALYFVRGIVARKR